MSSKWISLAVTGFALFSLASTSNAKTASVAKKQLELKIPSESFQVLDDSSMGPLVKQAHERAKKRNVASSDALVSEAQMSPELKSFRDRFLQAKTPDDVAREIAFLENGYNGFPLDLQYFASQFIPMKAFRGIVYRLTPLAQKEKITHSALVSSVQHFVERYTMHLSQDHSKALLDYVIAPYVTSGGRVVGQINSSFDLQTFFVSELYPLGAQALERLQKMEIGKQEIVWDNKIVYGTTSFIDDVQRYKILGDADRYAVIAGLHFALANLSFASAYNLEDLTSLVKAEGQLVGIDGFPFAKVDGATSLDHVKVLKEGRYKSLFTLMDNGMGWTRRSLVHSQQALRYVRLVWEEIKNRPAQEFAVMNSSKILPWEKDIEINLTMAEALAKGKTQVRSAITGETIIVDLPAFMMNPPRDLKDLAPTGFDTGDKNAYASLVVGGKSSQVKYRNYYYGRATDWNLSAYKALFPELASGKDVKKASRIFSETWNNSQVIALPFTN